MTATPRTQVSTAGFYDWSSEEVGDVSVTNIYRKIAITQSTKYNKGNKHWCADGIHLNPGRMFVRDKADLTKGEREIIAGIYKNRGDVRNGVVTHIKSHKDAWLIGKQIPKKGSHLDSNKCAIRVPDHLFSRLDSQTKQQEAQCYLCDECKDDCFHVDPDKVLNTFKDKIKDKKPGIMAPPSSPSNSPRSQRKQQAIPPKKSMSEGAVFIESGKTFYDPEEGSKKKKVFVDVFLPKFPTLVLNEENTSLSIDLEADNNKTNKKKKQQNSDMLNTSNDSIKDKLFGQESVIE